MSGWGYFFLFVLIVAILAPIAWVLYTRFRAHQAGLPPPPLSSYNPFTHTRASDGLNSRIYPAPSGALGWAKNQFAKIRGGGAGTSRSGAYEQPSSLGGGGGRGRGGGAGLDPDEAWDSRVEAEADAYGAGGYYEERELGLRPPGGSGHGAALSELDDEQGHRGRSISRDEYSSYEGGGSNFGRVKGYDEEEHGENPFGEGAERSDLRGVSPRPHREDDGLGIKKDGDSPTERRSMFHEGI